MTIHSDAGLAGQTETPMSDHITHFMRTLQEPHVRILVDMRRDHEDGSHHWDSSSFGDDVAKAIATRIEQLTADNAAQAARIAELEKERVWRLIETAPKNTEVLIAWQHWSNGEWIIKSGIAFSDNGPGTRSWNGDATHWQPLPSPPLTHKDSDDGR